MRQTPRLERARAEGGLRKETIATLEGRMFDGGGTPLKWVLAHDHGKLEHLHAETPAVANAVFTLTGKRIRSLPLEAGGVRFG